MSLPLVSGNEMPAIGLGTWRSNAGEVEQAVKDAILEVGYRHIDCAAIYGNEAEIGTVFKSVLSVSSDAAATAVKREDLFVTSKLWNSKHAPDKVESTLRRTLSDLHLDYLDLYLIHWPVIQDDDDDTKLLPLEGIPIEDTWKALEACVDKGLVRDIGVSNFSAAKLKSLWETARIKPSVNQVERHPYLQQPKLVEFCKEHGIVLTAYSPLGKGTRYSGTDAGSLLDDETIIAIATKHGVTPAQVLICWAVACGTGVIPKSTKKHRLQENFQSIKFTLDEDDMTKLTALDKHQRYVDGTAWCGEASPYTLENLWDESGDK
jgi:alcohol dehydrogenase (NADP+)